jgi:hypothetical protein
MQIANNYKNYGEFWDKHTGFGSTLSQILFRNQISLSPELAQKAEKEVVLKHFGF